VPAPRRALSARGRAVADAAIDADTTPARSFAPCLPSLGDFPAATWGRLAARHARLTTPALLLPGEPAGYRPLREAVAAYVTAGRGVRCDWRQVLIVTSTQQALDLAARLLLDPGDEAWIEEPGYLGARAALEAAGARVVPVPVDDQGLDVAAGEARAPRARLAYVTPSHQYPLGVTLTLERRLALLAWAARTGAWVVEDDYDSEFRYDGRPLAAAQGLDDAGRVLYVGTFNKVLFPALRLAYLVVPSDLVDAFAAARTLADGHPPTFPQAVLADFIAAGHFAAHLRHMRGVYRERRDALRAAAAEHLAGRVRLGPADAGMHVVAWLERERDDRAAARRCGAAGLDVPPLSRYYVARPPAPGLLIHYAGTPPRELRQGIRTLADALGAAEGGRHRAG
jgi:GntR family transcriptional regulator/MocR family aminotransferase